jgi:splicing factor 3B subunit 3
MHLRIEAPPVLGNEHGAFRSSYFPVKAVVDGDLCEQFGRLGADAQRRISEEMDRTPSEIVKRLEQIRARAG